MEVAGDCLELTALVLGAEVAPLGYRDMAETDVIGTTELDAVTGKARVRMLTEGHLKYITS
jgi:hypothetical protein